MSFKGAGMYFLADRNATTTERVKFTHCENLPTQDPHKALGWMAWTCKIAPELKAKAGVAATGQKGTRKPVYTVSLAWHPEQRPDRNEMIRQGRAWLEQQGLKDHQVVMACHTDRDHPHLHLIVNLVHPGTGRVAKLSYSKLKSSRWAQELEQADGKVYCKERVANNRRRGRAATQDRALSQDQLKDKVSRLYWIADSGQSFVAALRSEGYIVAQGERTVIVDQTGKVQNLVRLLEDVNAKQLKARLQSVPLPSARDAQAIQQSGGRQCARQERTPSHPADTTVFDRDQDDRNWQEAVIDASLAHDQEEQRPRIAPRPVPAAARNVLQSRHHDEMAALKGRQHEARQRQADEIKTIYGPQEKILRKEIRTITLSLERPGAIRKIMRTLTGETKRDAETLAALRTSLQNIGWRKQEIWKPFDSRVQEEDAALRGKHEREAKALESDPRAVRLLLMDDTLLKSLADRNRDALASEATRRTREQRTGLER